MVKATVYLWVKPENNSDTWSLVDPTIELSTLGDSIYYTKQESYNKLRSYIRTNDITDCYYEVVITDTNDDSYIDSDSGGLEDGVFYDT